jgi:formylglycine-generating enzyme required for sulfatase activity
LLSLVKSERLVLFYAQSGAGKSSLIHARLRPSLRQQGFDVLPIGRVSGVLLRGIAEVDNIFVFNLILKLNEDDQDEYDSTKFTQTTLKQYLQQRQIKGRHDDRRQKKFRALIVDQFEEILTTNLEHWEKRADFFGQLQEAMEADPLLWVILVLREDYAAGLDPYAQLLPGKLRTRFYMQRLSRQAALAAIKRPAELAGRPFAPNVAESLVDDLRQIRVRGPLLGPPSVLPKKGAEESFPSRESSPGDSREVNLGQFVEPVQLQVVCFQLWENLKEQQSLSQPSPTGEEGQTSRPLGRIEGGQITSQDLQEAGDVDTALAKFYEQALEKTLDQTQVTELELRHWFGRQLITEAGTRGSLYQGPEETVGLPNAAVKTLADQFLLRAEMRAGGAWYELVHDRFVEPILQANQSWQEQQPLIQVARIWLDSGRSESRLLEGQALQEALDSNWQALGPLVAEFLEAGQAAQQHKKETLRAEKDAQQARELEAARRLAGEQEARAREQTEAAAKSRRQAIWLAVLGAIAVILAIVAAVLAGQARSAQSIAERARTTAETVLDRVAQQDKFVEILIQFSQTTDPVEQLTLLDMMFGSDQGSLARRLFWDLPEESRTTLLAAFEDSSAAYPNLAQAGLFPITDSKGAKMVLVPPGPFEMGSDNGSSDEQPVHSVTLDAFLIDQYEVTNADFRQCVEAGNCQAPTTCDFGAPTYEDERKEDHPVVCVSWNQARAYCEWRGDETRLLTEAEWEKAARGTDGRTYPWGEELDCDHAQYRECGGGTKSVGNLPAGVSPYGAHDMAGNVWEWVQSEFRNYPYRADDGREEINSTNVRVLRGGSSSASGLNVHAALRSSFFPTLTVSNVGFRCAR